MTWKRKAYQVAEAFEGTVIQWHPMGRNIFASVEVQTEDGWFQAIYSKCLYLSMGNNVSSPYAGALAVTVGIDGAGTDRFEVVYKNPPREHVKRILTAFLRLKHPGFQLEKVLGSFSISNHERMEWILELQSEQRPKAA